MTIADDLLARVIADPDDLETRAVYADALAATDEKRAELIALDVSLATAGVRTVDALVASSLTGDALAHRAAQHRRVRELATRHDRRSGFLERLHVTDHIDDLAMLDNHFRREPIRELSIRTSEGFAPFERIPLAAIRRLELACDDEALSIAPILENCPNLEALVLRESTSAEHIAQIPQLPKLRTLVVRATDAAAFDALGAHSIAAQLEDLELEPRRVSDPGVWGIARVLDGRFPRLRRFATEELSDDDLLAEPALVVPPVLELVRSGVTEEGVARLAQPSLRSFSIGMAGRRVLDVLLARCPDLVSLDIPAGIYDESAELLAAAPQRLRHLRLYGAVIPPRTLAKLVAAHDLETLAMSTEPAHVITAVAREPRMRSLRELFVDDGKRVPVETIRLLAFSPHLGGLRRIDLEKLNLDDDAVTTIAASPYLHDLIALDLRRNLVRITPALRAMPALVEITVDSRSNDIMILCDTFDYVALEDAVRDVGFASRNDEGDFTVILDPTTEITVSIIRHQSRGFARAAARVVDPKIRARVAQLGTRIDLDVRHRPSDPTKLVALARAIATACNGVVWDRYEDTCS